MTFAPGPVEAARQAVRLPARWHVATWTVVILSGILVVVQIYALMMSVVVAVDLLTDIPTPLPQLDRRDTDIFLAALWLSLLGHVTAFAVWLRSTVGLVSRHRAGRPGLRWPWCLWAWAAGMTVGLLLPVVGLTGRYSGPPTGALYLLVSTLQVALWTAAPTALIIGVLIAGHRVRAFLAQSTPGTEALAWKAGEFR